MLPGLGEPAELRNERGSARRMQEIKTKAASFYLLICSYVWLVCQPFPCKFIYIYFVQYLFEGWGQSATVVS